MRLPSFARPLLAAHRAYRLAVAGRSTALLFPSPADAKKPAAPSALRHAARQQAERLKVHTPWIKPVGALPGAEATWLSRRALTVDQLTDILQIAIERVRTALERAQANPAAASRSRCAGLAPAPTGSPPGWT